MERLPAGWMVDVHHFGSEFCFWLIVFHVLGVVLMSRLLRRNLIRAMITGRKSP